MQRFEVHFKKMGWKNYIVSGKAKPCSSKAKIMAYVTQEFHKLHIEAGRITIEGEKDGQR